MFILTSKIANSFAVSLEPFIYIGSVWVHDTPKEKKLAATLNALARNSAWGCCWTFLAKKPYFF